MQGLGVIRFKEVCMERKIRWMTGCHDEIELVYEKAEANDSIGAVLSELEEMALKEAHDNCGIVVLGGEQMSPEKYEALPGSKKEQVMYYLGKAGLMELTSTLTEPLITVTLSPMIQLCLGCTMFNLLNRLEKLDGAFNARFPKATLRIQAPLGGKKGLMKCEMLIMQLYPWLSVNEVSTNQIAFTSVDEILQAAKPEEAKAYEPEPVKDERKEKPGFFKRLFGKK